MTSFDVPDNPALGVFVQIALIRNLFKQCFDRLEELDAIDAYSYFAKLNKEANIYGG